MQEAQPQLPSFLQYLPRSTEDIPRAYSWFEQMRTQHPVFNSEPLPLWQIFGYEEVKEVLTDYSRFSSKPLPGFSVPFLEDTLVSKDPPDHRKLRNLVNLAFTPRAVAHLSDRITQITQELLDQVRAQGKMDIVSDIAFPLPAKVIAEMLGVPDEDWDIFQRWAMASGGNTSGQEIGPPPQNMFEEMGSYFSKLLEERRKSPREDLVSALSVAEIDGERLSENELVHFCILLLAAGQETTKNLIANAILCFTDYPDVLERVRRDPALMPNAIEEVLRYLPPVWFLFRRTTTDVELGGQHIPANQAVLTWLAAACRDAGQFPDADQFIIDREPNRHVTFGHGIHFCIGAPLARLEAKIALPMMLEQMQDLRRVEGIPIEVHTGVVFVIESLPVTFKPF
ncbi:MAG TPA: cytochrome P450 [Ktedonobacteraceae bacterium]|nr:cytochrome P450 [Ktedonobacteraceae bacterium]